MFWNLIDFFIVQAYHENEMLAKIEYQAMEVGYGAMVGKDVQLVTYHELFRNQMKFRILHIF